MSDILHSEPVLRFLEADQGWVTKAEAQAQLDEINGASDRAAVILSTALLEDALLIRLMVERDGSKQVRSKRVDDAISPRATFYTRIEVASELGLTPPNVSDALRVTRVVRNAAAHSRRVFSFQPQPIVDVVRLLVSLVPSAPADHPAHMSARELFIWAVYILRGHVSLAYLAAGAGLPDHQWKRPD